MRQKATAWPSPGLTGKVVGAVAYNLSRLRDRRVLSEVGPLGTLAGRTMAAVGARLGSPSSAPIFGASPQKLVRRPQSVFPRSSNPLAETLPLSLNIFGTRLSLAGQDPLGWPGRGGYPSRGPRLTWKPSFRLAARRGPCCSVSSGMDRL